MPSVNTIMLIFALAALGILALSTLVGFFAGFKRELKLMIVFVVLLGLVWLVLGNVALILDAQLPAFATTMLSDILAGVFPDVTLGEFTSFRGLIVEVVGSLVPDIKNLLVEGTKTYSLLMSFVEFVLRFALILVGTIVVYVLCILIRLISFVIRAIYRLFTIRRRRRRRKELEAKRETGLDEGVVAVKSDIYDGEVVVTLSRNTKKYRRTKRRLWGAGLGLLRGAFTVLLICVPITGLLSIVNEVEPETVDMVLDIMNGGNEQGKVADDNQELLDWLFEFADEYDSGIVAEIIGSSEYFLGKGLDETLFDNLLKIETSTQTIYLREEIFKLIQVANMLPEAYVPGKSIPIDIWSLSDVKQDQIIEILKDFKLLYEAMPVAIEYAGTMKMVQDLLEPSGQTLDALGTVDWSKDLPYILDAVRCALELGDITVNFDPLKLNSDVLRDVVSNIGATDFITKLMPIVINAALFLELNPNTENEFKVSDIIGEWPKENVIVTDGIVWENELVNLVDIYEQFQSMELDLANLDINALIGDSEKMEIVKSMLTKLVTSDLFIDVLLQVVDFAKEFQLGKLGFEEFKDILKFTNLVAEDWAEDINDLIDMVMLVEEIGVLGEEGFNFDNPERTKEILKEMISKLINLNLISNKAGVNYTDPQKRQIAELFNEVKTLLVEAALRQFDLFDVEGGFQFDQFTPEEREDINWADEELVLHNVVDALVDMISFFLDEGYELETIADHATELLNYDETFDYLIDVLDALVDSDLAMTLIPYALDKFVSPLIEEFEDQANLPDGDKIDITDSINKDNISEEIFNLIYILMDARELGLLGVVTEDELNLTLDALAYNPTDSASFDEMCEKLGYRPAQDDLALVDIINRIFYSKLFEGNEAKLFRILFALLLDTRVSKDAINAIDFSVSEESERAILVDAINGLRPILGDFDKILVDGELNFDYFLEKTIALDVVDSARKLFTSQIVAVLLPELYHQYLLPQGMIPEEFAELFTVQSLYLAEHKKDNTYLEGLTGQQLTQDLVTIITIAELLIDFDALNFLDEEKDILFADATDTFNRLFDLILQLNLLEDNGDKLAAVLVKMLLDVEIPLDDFEDLGVDWKAEVQLGKDVIASVFELLENSGIEGYKKLNEVLDDPMAYLENFLVDANLEALADIITKVSESQALATVALPLVNKFVPDMVEGLGQFTEEEYSGEMICEDINALADILYNIAEAELMATVKVLLSEFTDLLPVQDQAVEIPLRHDLYAEILEEIFALNILEVPSVKQYVVDTLKDTLSDMDLSSVDPEGLDFARDGKVLADAYLAFIETFEQDIYDVITVADVLAIINGEVELTEFTKAINENNINAIVELVDAIINTTLVNEFSLVIFDLAKDMVPENLSFLVNADLTKGEFTEDLHSVIDILESVIDIISPALPELEANIAGIMDGTVDILSLELAFDLDNLFDEVKLIAKAIDDMNLIDGRGAEIIIGAFGLADITITKEDLANVDFAVEKANAQLAVAEIIELLVNNELNSLKAVMDLTENLSLENTDLINTENVLAVLDIVKYALDSEFVQSVFGPVYDALLKDMIPADFASILEFDEEYAASDLVEDLSVIVSALQNIVSFEVVEFAFAEGELQWQNFGLVTDAIRQIFTIELLDAKETEILDVIAKMVDLELVDVADIDWVQTGDKLADALDNIGAALQKSNALNKLADLDVISDNLSAFLTTEIINDVINGLDELVDASIIEALIPTIVNYAAEQLPGKLKTALLMDGLTPEDYVYDINTVVSMLRDLNDMGLAGIVQSVLDNDINSITWTNTENIIVVLEKVLQLRFWDNKQMKVIEGILELGGVEVPAELAQLDTALENQIVLDVLREIVTLVDTLFAENGTTSVGSVTSFLDTLGNNDVLADVANNALSTLSNIYAIAAESGYVKLLYVPAFDALLRKPLEKMASDAFGSANKSIANLECYSEDPEALVNDLLKLSAVFKYLHDSDIVNVVLLEGYQINYGKLLQVADAIETLFSLELLASKEDVLANILAHMSDEVDLTDGVIDFSNDGEKLATIIKDLIKFANSGVITINSLSDLSNIDFVLENLLSGDEPSVKLLFDALKAIADISVLDEGLAFAHHLIIKNIKLPEGLEFALELGPNGTPGLVNDYLTIIQGIENIYDLGFTELLFNENVKLEFAQVLSAFVKSIFELDFLDGKGDKAIEYLANEIGYPELNDLIPLDWEAEYEAFETLFYNLEGILWECGFIYSDDIMDFMKDFKLQNVIDLLNNNVLTLGKEIVKSVAGSIVVQATLGAAAYYALPLVEGSLPEDMKPLVRLDDITVSELVEDIQSIIAIIADIDNFNLFNAVLFGEDFIYDASAYLDEELYALQEAFELLFGLNYLNAKLDTIGVILGNMNEQFASIDFDYLQQEAIAQVVYALRSQTLGMSNFAYDGVLLGQVYANLVENVFSDPKWTFNSLNDFGQIKILDNFYSRNIINGILDAFASILDLNTVQAAIPFVYELLGSSFAESNFGFIVDYILETPAAELQADLVTIISAFKAIANNHEFNYEDDLRAFLNSGKLNKLNFNLSMIEAFPEILDDLSKLNVLNYIKGDRLVEIVKFALDTAMPSFDQTNVNWQALSTLFDYLDENPDELTSFVQVFAILANIINEDIEYDEFKELYADLTSIQISKNEKLLNENVVNSVLDILDIVINSTLVESFFYAVYDNFLAETINGMEPVGKLLDVYSYPSVIELQEDLTAFINIARELVDFDVLGIVFFEREIEWTNTTPIENIFKHIFGLNYLDDEAGLPKIVEFLSEMVDLSQLDLASVADGLASDAELIGLAYRILATEIFVKEIFPVHSMADLNKLEFNVGDFLNSEMLHSAVNAIEQILSTNLVKEALEVAYYLGQMNLPDDLFFLVSNPLTGEELQSDLFDILSIVRELIDAEAYNAMLKDQAIPFEGISDHLIYIIDTLLHTNIISKDADSFVSNALALLGISVSKDLLEAVDYEQDLNNLYEIIDIIETILIRSDFNDHAELLDFVNNLDLSTILDNEVLINNNNLNYILDIIENLFDLSLLPVLYEPLYEKFVVLENMPEAFQGFLDLSEYSSDMLIEDLHSIVNILRSAVEFDALSIVRGYAFDWDNIEPIEAIITEIFGLNYLDVKLDDIIAYVSENIFDLSDLDVEGINLEADGEAIAKVYRMLAEAVLSQNWFPLQYMSDLESLSTDSLPFEELLSEEVLSTFVDVLETILNTTLVYEIVPVMYGYAQTIVPDDLFFVVSNSLTKDELISDVLVIVTVLREVVAAEAYNVVLEGKALPFEGISEHLINIIDALAHMNIISTDADRFVSNVLGLFGISVSSDLLESVNYEHDLNNLYNVIEIIEAILIESKLTDHAELLDFVNNLDLSTIIDNEDLINNNNLYYILDIIENVIDLSLVPVLYEPLYEKFVVLENMPEAFQGFLDLSEYSSDMLIEDLHSIINVLRSAVTFDALGIIRGNAINWNNIAAIENIFTEIFGLNYLDVKLDEIINYVSENIFDLTDLDVEGINLEADGEALAKVYRMLAEAVLAQTWFPIQFASDLSSLQMDSLPFKELLSEEVLSTFVDAIETILSTTLVYEIVPVMYGYAQTIVPDDLFFLVSQSLTKDELQEDVLAIVNILREVIAAEAYKLFLGEELPLAGIDQHLVNVLATIFGLNLVDEQLNDVFYNIFNLFGIDVDRTLLNEININNDLDKLYNVFYEIGEILQNSKFETHQDLLDFVKEFGKVGITHITKNEDVLSNANLLCVLDALENIVGLDLLQLLYEPLFNKFIVVENMPEALQGFLDISEYPASMLVEDLQSIISALRSVVEFDVLGVLRGSDINWSNIEAVEHVINTIFGLNLLSVKLDEAVEYVSANIFDLSELYVEGINLEADGAKLAAAYRIIAETILTQDWFPLKSLDDLDKAIEAKYLLTAEVLNKVVDALNEILTTSIVYEAVPVAYSFAQTIIPDDLFFLVSNSLTKDELQEDVLAITAILRELINAEVYNFVLKDQAIPFEGIAEHVSNVLDIIFNMNILDADPINLYIGAFKLFGIELTREDLESVDTSADQEVLFSILGHLEDILLALEITDHKEMLDFVKNLNVSELLNDEKVICAENVNSLLAILEDIFSLSLLPAIFEPAYNKFVPDMISGMPEDLQAILSIDDYDASAFIADAKSLVYVLRQAVEFGAIDIYFGKEINWSNTQPIENVIETIFALNFLNAKLDEIVAYVSNTMFDLSDLDVEALRGKLANDGVILADVYAILASEIFALEIFPVKTKDDFASLSINPGDFLTEEILTSAVDAIEKLLELGLIYEALPVAYAYAQTIVPDDLYYLVANSLTKDELIADVSVIVTVLREAVAAKAYNVMLKDEALPFEGIAEHLINIIDALAHMNIISKDADTFVSNTLGLFGISVSKELLDSVDYEHDLNNLYAIIETIETILIRSNFADHVELLDFVNNLDFSTILDNEDLINNNNIDYIIDIIENIVDLSLLPVLYEPLYEKFVVVENMPEAFQGFLDLAEYSSDMLIEDLRSVVTILRSVVDFDALGAYRGAAIYWDNIEAIETIINEIFGLNYLDVKLDEIVEYVSASIFDLADLDVTAIDLEADGAKIALAYRILAESILTQNWFPIQFFSDMSNFNFDIVNILDNATLHNIIDALNEILTTSIVYEALPVAYDTLQNSLPDSLFFLVSNSLNKDELAEDVQSIVLVLREIVDSEAYKFLLDEEVPLEGIADHLSVVIDTIVNTNILGKDYANLFSGLFNLFGIEISREEFSDVDFDDDFDSIYDALNDIEDILVNANLLTHKDLLTFINDFSKKGINYVTTNEEVLNNNNLILLLDALSELVGLDLLEVIFKPVYDKFVVIENMPADLQKFFDLSDYSSEMFVEDLQTIISALRSVVEFDVLSVLRGAAINWSNIEDVENVITSIFSLNLLSVKLDEIMEFVSDKVFDLSSLDVNAIDLEADGAKLAAAYRILAETVLTQNWFPIQFLSDMNKPTFYSEDIFNANVLHKALDALNEILTTTIVYEIVPVAYETLQNMVPDSLFFLVSNSLSKDELAEDLQSIVLVLREAIDAGAYNVLLGKGIEIEGIADHIANAIETLFNTNILGNDLPNLFSGLFGLIKIDIEKEEFDSVDFDHDFNNIRNALNAIEDILLNAQLLTHIDIINYAKGVRALTDITTDELVLNNANLDLLINALEELVNLDILTVIFEPVYHFIFAVDKMNETVKPFFDITEYPTEMFIEDLNSIIEILRNVVDFDALGALRGEQINWENIDSVENVIKEIFGLNYLNVKLDSIVELVSDKFFDLSAVDASAINLLADGDKLALAYRNIAESVLTKDWFPIQYINDINDFTLRISELMDETTLYKLVDALNEILTTTLVYELSASLYDLAQDKVSDKFFFLLSNDLTKDQLAEDLQSIILVLREAIAAELYKDIIGEGIPVEGLAAHVSTIVEILLHTNILGSDYIRLFANIFQLAGLDVEEGDLTGVDFEHDFAILYQVFENIEDILLNAEYITHMDVLTFVRNMPAIKDIINDNQLLVSDANLYEVLDSVDLLIDLSMVPALYEILYNKFVKLENHIAKVQPLLDIINYGADLFVEDAHALVDVLEQLVAFGALEIYRGGTIDWSNTTPIENIITILSGLNYVDVKLEDIINLNPYESINTALLDIELIRANLEADAVVLAQVYKQIAQDILTRNDFPCQTLEDVKAVSLQTVKDFYSKEVALLFLEDIRPLIDTVFGQELLVVAYDLVQAKTPEKLQYVVEASLTKDQLRSDAHDLIDAMKIMIESDLVQLIRVRDVALEGISEPVNELIEIAAHTNLIGGDLARFVEGTFALLGMTVSYDELSTVDYEHDLLITYDIVEDIEKLLLNCNATTVKEALQLFRDVLKSGRDVLRNKELVNETNALLGLEIFEKSLDLDIARVLAEPVYSKVMNKVVDALGLPAELANTARYDYSDCINDARIAIEIAREAIAFGAIEYYQDDVLIEWTNVTPVQNMIILGLSTEFWNEFDYELIKFVGDKIGYDLVTDIDIESIDWIADSAVFAEAYEIVALGILSDPEFTVKRYSELRAFDFNLSDYTKERFALTGIDALDLCVETTLFDAYALTVLEFINNRLPESLQFVIAETTISDAELRSDAHAGLYLAKLAINEGFHSVVKEKDCEIIKPDFYKEAIQILFDLNITSDSDVRVRLINVVLSRIGLDQIDSISDWDNEEQAYLAIVDDVCEFLAKNDITTLKELYSFLVNKEFISGSFLTDENALEILDIMEKAIQSEVVTKVSASVYSKVVEKLPFESVKPLVEFGTDARDYTKEGFYNDLPLFIEIAKDIINLNMLDVLRHKDWLIASSDDINALIEKGVQLELVDGRLDLYADFVFDVLGVEVDLNGIDWDNEIEVLQNVIDITLPALQASGMTMLSDVKALALEILDSPVAFVKNNRAYANLTNAYVVLDTLEELENSEVYMRSLLKLYNRFSHKLPAAITNYVDLSTYPEAELRADYQDMLAIARYALDAQLYRFLVERRGWEFTDEAVAAIENIIALGCDLNFTARYTEGVIRMVANVVGISNLPANLDQINLSEDKDEFISVVESVRNIWNGTNHIQPNIPMLANKDLFVEISYVMETLLDTTLSNVFAPWIYENYVTRIINKLPTLDGRIDYSKLLSYTGSEVIALAEDGISVFNELIAMNVFGTTGIDFTDNSHVKTMLDILLKHVGFSARIENYLVRLAERSYLMGVIPVSYDQVTSTRSELSVIKGILVDTLELYSTYGSALISRDFAKLLDGGCENMVLAIIDKFEDSVLLNTSFIPALNGFGDVVIGPEDAVIYTACQVSTIAEFKEAVAELFDIAEALEELGFLSKQIKYKDTEGFKQLFKLIENSPFFQGQEGIIAEFLLRNTDYIDHNDVDLRSINWANEYQYLYEFLDKANAPLNMNGIVITDYKALLNNSVFMNAFADALRAFAPSELMVEMFMPLFDIASGKFAMIGDLLDYSHLESLDDAQYANAIEAEYLSILDLVVAVSESGIMADNNIINVNKLLAVYDIVFALEGTKNNKGDIFNKLSDKLPSFGDAELVIPSDVNWDTEIPAIRGIFASLIYFADVDGNINLNEIADIISESTDVVAFEALLTAINQSVIYRTQLFNTLNDEINNVSPDGDIVISRYLTAWFENQEVNGMASIAEWDSEMIYLARILTIVNYMRQNAGFSDLANMNLGKDVTEDASVVSSDQFNVVNYGLKQLLQLMGASKSFTLEGLNSDLEKLLIDNDQYDGLIKTDKQLNALSNDQWVAEINDLVTLIHNIQVLNLLDSSMAVADRMMLCTTAEIEELLVSFNHCDAIRVVLPDMLAETLDSADAADWKSLWLMDQVGVDGLGNNKPMASTSEWDYEAKQLATIITLIDKFDFSQEISTYDQNDIDNLRELLNEMNHDKSLDVSYIITFLNKNVLDKGLINTTKKFENPTTWDMAKWDLELDRMVDVIAVAIENNLFGSDSGNALANMGQAQIESILKAINNSEIMRTVLPDLVYNAVKSAGQDSWLSEDKWLEQQVGQNAGVNNSVESIDAWANEIEKYAFIISKSTSFDFANLDLSNNAELTEIKEILKAMNDTKSFTLDPIVDIINDLLDGKGYNVSVIGVIDGANKDNDFDMNGSNKDEWATEIDVLFIIVEKMNSLGAIDDNTLSTNAQSLGELLDQMKVSYLFGNDVRDDENVTVNDNVFNVLVMDVLTTSNMIKDGTNNGFIDKATAEADDWSRYNWTAELSIISAYDKTTTSQSDAFISSAQTSDIIKKYFDIAGELNARIDVTFTLLGNDYNLKSLVETANGGPLTNEGLATRVWADELADVNTLTTTIDSFNGSIGLADVVLFAAQLDGIRSNPTLAGGVANHILGLAGL